MSSPIVVVDAGNHSCKVSVSLDGALSGGVSRAPLDELAPMVRQLARHHGSQRCLLSSVVDGLGASLSRILDDGIEVTRLSHTMRLPFRIGYKRPGELGTDRIAAAAGVVARRGLCDAIIIDAGTAITYDYLSAEGVLLGGTITPGLALRLAALHEHTARLPLCSAAEAVEGIPTDTRAAIATGVVQGVRAEATHFVNVALQLNPRTVVALTGGDYNSFELSREIDKFASANLVLEGLALIARDNL